MRMIDIGELGRRGVRRGDSFCSARRMRGYWPPGLLLRQAGFSTSELEDGGEEKVVKRMSGRLKDQYKGGMLASSSTHHCTTHHERPDPLPATTMVLDLLGICPASP